MQAAANENIYACGRLTIDIETNWQIVFARTPSPIGQKRNNLCALCDLCGE